jgi:hypothetical protein
VRAIVARLDKLEEQAAGLDRLAMVAFVLDLPTCPDWAVPLDGTRCVRLIGGEEAARRRVLTRLRKAPDGDLEGVVRLEHRRVVSEFIALAVTGPAREVAAFGARGDRKTSGALAAMLLHADLHRAAGHALPVRWMGITDTFRNHLLKTCRTLEAPWWRGLWQLCDGGHLAVAVVGGVELVHLDLFGIEDQGANDKARAEAHAAWIEEPAPAMVLETSSGVSEDTLALALTSLRLPSHHRPALLTLNYPDADAWPWRRYVERRHPGTAYVRIPPGESASAEDRAAWAEALEGRPDLLRRLLLGEPGTVVMGEAVAQGYREDWHVAGAPLEPRQGVELGIGWDAGHWPTTVIGQLVAGQVRIYAALVTPKAGTRQHIEQALSPWLAQHAPWAQARGIRHWVDPNMDTGEQADIDQSPVTVIRRLVGGAIRDGAVSWPGRRDPVLAVLSRLTPAGAALQINPGVDTEILRRALAGRWFYPKRANGEVVRDLPEKNHPWSDAGDSLAYLVAGLAPARTRDEGGPLRQTHAYTMDNPSRGGKGQQYAETRILR